MARRARRKQTGVIGTLMVELSALAGIFGIAQPAVRTNLWQMVRPAAINSQANPPASRESAPLGSQPRFDDPSSNIPEPDLVYQPSAYTARAVVPQRARNQSAWKASGYNPMGNYQ